MNIVNYIKDRTMEYKRLFKGMKYIDVRSICNGNITAFEGIDRLYKLTNVTKLFLKGEEFELVQKTYDLIDFVENDARGKEYADFNLSKQLKYLIKVYPVLTMMIKNKQNVRESLLIRKSIRTILNALTNNLPNNIDDNGKFFPTKEEHGTTSLFLWKIWYSKRKYRTKKIRKKESEEWFKRLKQEREDVIREEERINQLEHDRLLTSIKKCELELLEIEIKSKQKGRYLR